MLRASLSALLVLGMPVCHAQAETGKRSDKSAAARPSDDDDGPDYYEGQDAPTGTVNPESVGARPADADAEAPANGPLWMEAASDAFLSFSQNQRASASTAFRVGNRFPLVLPLDVYALIRFDRDQRDIQWDNHVDAGAGLRLSLPKSVPVSLAAEWVGGEYLHSSFSSDLPQGASGAPLGFFVEYRADLKEDWAWGHVAESIYADTPWFSFPLRYWGRIRSEILYSYLSRREAARTDEGVAYRTGRYQNVTLLFHPDAGVLLMEGLAGGVAAYGTAQLRINSLGDWWNDLAMAGPGVSYQPLFGVDLFVKAEYLMGRYLWHGRAVEPRPYPEAIHDLRIFLDLNYALGL